MKTIRQSAKSIDKDAADWVARMDAGNLTADQEAELSAWLASDSRCLGAYARARALFVSPQLDLAVRPRRAPPVDRRAFLAMAGAGLAAAAIVWERRDQPEIRLFQSEIGEIRQIPLEDGSRITLNTDSAVAVEYGKDSRLVTLKRGEAYFEVAKNPERPFIVKGPAAQARAVGTAFSVRLADTMKVRVTEGRVAIEPPRRLWPTAGSANAVLGAHQEAEVRGGDGIQVFVRDLPADLVERGLMWREGLLSFEGATLAEAIAEFSRYSRLKIDLKGAVAREKISGLFSATDPSGFARAVSIGLKLKIKNENDEIILYK